MTQAPARLAADALNAFAARCFEAVGMRPDEAALVADSLVSAELRGVTSHGLIRLPVYLANIKDGLVSPTARPTLAADGPAVATLDGHGAVGQVASKQGMEIAIERARSNGIGPSPSATATTSGPAPTGRCWRSHTA